MPARSQGRATIRDVAARAGVSFKSVSNVVNNHPFVSEDMRQKVQQAIAELGYRPHSVARNLANRRSNMLGLVLRASSTDAQADPFLTQFLLGACAVAGAQGFGMMVRILLTDEPILRYADLFDHQQVDGLMIFSPRIDDAEGDGDGDGQDHDLPAVRIGRAGTGTNALAVDGDDEQGAFAAVSHLATLGHKRIGMVANANLSYTVSVTRVQGYRQALQAHGIPFDERLLTVGQFTRQSGQDSMARLLDIDEPPSAVFISSDRMALGAMRAARDRGLRIPEDIAIVGYDDLFVAEHTNPPLTTVRAPIDAISQCATNMLIEAIRGGKRIGSRQIILPTELIVRQSCGAKAATSYA